jgi:hypothetical protein
VSAREPYDRQGWLCGGVTMVRNTTGKREAVLTEQQWRTISEER